MSSEIMRALTGMQLECQQASLKGYLRRQVKDGVFPAIIAQPNCAVEGAIYLDLPTCCWEPLDRFEGDLYQRKCVPVNINNQQQIEAEAYILHPDHHHRFGAHNWDFELFLQTSLDGYLNRLRG